MEKFSQITRKIRIPLKIHVFPHLFDHQFMGKAVLPAVEAMKILLDSAQTHMDNIDNGYITSASFDKFFPIKDREKSVEAYNDIEVYENGLIQTKLVTRFQSTKTTITRFIEHARLSLSVSRKTAEETPIESEALLGENRFEIAPDIIYRELVPFGPAYRNIRKPLVVSPNGAVASVYGGDPPSDENHSLGSPFVLDAAFHGACAWGQCYHNVVAFPVGFDERHIIRPTCFGKTYIACIIPVHADKKLLVFHIHIADRESNVHEIVSGLRMKDVSGGRLKPPEWLLRI